MGTVTKNTSNYIHHLQINITKYDLKMIDFVTCDIAIQRNVQYLLAFLIFHILQARWPNTSNVPPLNTSNDAPSQL